MNSMPVCRCGNSGLILPVMTLGLWHSFGETTDYSTQKRIILQAFDLGIYHFDNANCYGPPNGAAEEAFGRVFHAELSKHRDELLIATKAGAPLGEGIYQGGGSRKHLISQLDKSLVRMMLDYVDIFYHHCPDPYTDIRETAQALHDIVRSGKALYIGVSNYSADELQILLPLLDELKTPCVICQSKYSMLHRDYAHNGLMNAVHRSNLGSIAYSVLAQGMLTGKYNRGIPLDSRIATDGRYIHAADVTADIINKTVMLEKIANERGQTLAQLALTWAKRTGAFTSVLIGASKPEQIVENMKTLDNTELSEPELSKIQEVLNA